MALSEGSAAVEKSTPRSAELEATRTRLRAELPARLKAMKHTLGLATRAVAGPDPESALAYLELLEERIQATLRSSQ